MAVRRRAISDPKTPAPSSPAAKPAGPPTPKRWSSFRKPPARSRPLVESAFSPLRTSPAFRFPFSAASSPQPQTPLNLPPPLVQMLLATVPQGGFFAQEQNRRDRFPLFQPREQLISRNPRQSALLSP